ncbi:MAG: [Ruminococcus sp.]|nr:[FeFe] hydrogenase H-cluster maturation GTPase HydF [Ruminococcus sp.]
MSLNSTPSADRVHIGIFGRRNAGKSSLINALTGQQLAIVSDVAGTTTDPVSKAMELLPLGPVVIIDTAGLDDEGELGGLRVKKTYQVLNKTDIALLVVSAEEGISQEDTRLLERIKDKGIPCLTVYTKTDLAKAPETDADSIVVSAATGEGIHELKERIAALSKEEKPSFPIIADKVQSGDRVVLVVPIDSAAPKGRLILPQQQTIRELLECGCTVLVCRETELEGTLASLKEPPRLVITDSQAFGKVAKIVPQDVSLTSFSILFSRHKGDLPEQVRGARALDTLKNGDRVLISEGCTHHRQCGDIGTVKLPMMIKRYTGLEDLKLEFTSGTEFPDDLSGYKLIIHCGGCMLGEREMKYRIQCARDAGIPITNYGVCLAQCNGILKRSLDIFPEI